MARDEDHRADLSGRRVADRYDVVERLGRGGVADVWLARDRATEEEVALKVARMDRPEAGALLAVEFERLATLQHPHLACALDLGRVDSRVYYSTLRIHGEPLSQGAWPQVRRALRDPIAAMAYLHGAGLRHGDLTPNNILVRADGRGVLLDLSAASALSEPVQERSGTPAYVAPEVLPGTRVDERADYYALGRIMQECVGDPPAAIAALTRALLSASSADRPASFEQIASHFEQDESRLIAAPPRVPPSLVGRQALMHRFDTLLDARELPRAVLVGRPGSGRTRLVREAKWMAQSRALTVHEGTHRAPRPVAELLGRGGARDESLVEHIERIRASPERLLFMLDDVDALAQSEARLLWGAMRALRDAPHVGFVLSSAAAPPSELGLEVLDVSPLRGEALSAWMRALSLDEVDRPRLERWTGGLPALLARGAGPGDAAGSRTDALEIDEHDPLAWAKICVAVGGGELSVDELIELGADHDALRALEATHHIVRPMGMPRLRAQAERDALITAAPHAALRALRERLVALLLRDSSPMSEPRDALALHTRAALGDVTEVAERLAQLPRARATAYRDVALELIGQIEALTPSARGADLIAPLACAARVLLDAGAPAQAAAVLAGGAALAGGAVLAGGAALAGGAVPSAASRCVHAEAELKLGHASRALEILGVSGDQTPDGLAQDGLDAGAVDIAARAHIARGEFARARDAALRAQQLDPAPDVRARLAETVALSSYYLGDHALGDETLELALAHHRDTGDQAGLIRAWSYRAIGRHQRGALDAALSDLRQVLELAASGERFDQLATATLNVGTVEQERGEWGSALRSYERASTQASLAGMGGLEASIAFNRANLLTEIGDFEQARSVAADAARIISIAGAQHLDAPMRRLEAELDAAQGDWDAALEKFHVDTHPDASREALEAQVLAWEIRLRRGEASGVSAELGQRDSELPQEAAEDLGVRIALAHAACGLHVGELPRALRFAEDALEGARRVRSQPLEADAETALANVYEARGLSDLAQEARRRAKLVWRKIEATLPPTYSDLFARHPRRAALYTSTDTPSAAAPSAAADAGKRLAKFLAINRKLTSTLALQEVLEYAVDAAIELSSAERGYVLIEGSNVVMEGSAAREGALEVAAARDVDRQRIPPELFAFSRSIAGRVVERGEAIVTVDAQHDARFAAHESVHAMKLQSVACVPIRSLDRVRGALYVDHRFEQGLFDAADLELLHAFADQVAIAVENAELHESLTQQTRDLERARADLLALVSGQARQIATLEEEVEHKQRALELRFDYRHIIGRGAAMRRVLALLDRVTDSDLSVLIEGESGTGKELVAKALHYHGARREQRLVSLNCAALPDTLIESELFGHVQGAFSGATRDKVGLLEAANGGTVFLDEIAEMPMSTQVKLLRALQEREVLPVGATEPRPIDIRLVCATHRDLERAVREGSFREDLFYRVRVVQVLLPPLRDRSEDLPELVAHFLPEGRSLTPAAFRAITAHAWPGNVRELENCLARACVLSDWPAIDVDALGLGAEAEREAPPIDREDHAEDERLAILAALQRNRWNVSRTSRELKIPRQTLYRRLAAYRLERPG